MSRPNWFFAFPIDGRFVQSLPALPPGFRRFHPEDVHLTLAFLGACGEDAAERGLRALDEVLAAAPRGAIQVSLGSVVPMGRPRAYSALSALLEQGRQETEDCLSAWCNVLLEAAVGRREKRPPKPHVTLARPTRRATEEDRKAGLAWAADLDLRAEQATLDRIALYTWSPLRRERLFRIVATRPLIGK
jgi:RNA 2',3'-cyclic 3'-phosphodiesterase